MSENLESMLAKIEQQPQRQDAANAQLADLAVFANKLGMYDAADYLRHMLSADQGKRA